MKTPLFVMASEAKPSRFAGRILDRRVASLLAMTVFGRKTTAKIQVGALHPIALSRLATGG
jgi:hypothetical protein